MIKAGTSERPLSSISSMATSAAKTGLGASKVIGPACLVWYGVNHLRQKKAARAKAVGSAAKKGRQEEYEHECDSAYGSAHSSDSLNLATTSIQQRKNCADCPNRACCTHFASATSLD